jgi:hypothetical protein
MTRRERVLATTLVAMLGVMGSGLLFHMFVYQPMSDVREELAQEEKKLSEAQGKLAEAEKQIADILHINPRLGQWQKISLPRRDPNAKPQPGVSVEEQQRKHIRQLQVEYEQFLSALLKRNGFEETRVQARQADLRSSPILKAKDPVYVRLPFIVTGKANLEAVMKALKEFYKTNLLHQVRSLSLAVSQQRGPTPMPAGTLDVTMQVETLMVNGAEERVGLMPSEIKYPLKVLAAPERRYDLAVKRNMFTGITPSERTYGKGELPPEVALERKEMLRFVKLTMLCYDSEKRRWEATLYNQAKGGDEITINRIWNEIKINQGSQVLLDAKMVLVDEKQLIFKEGSKYYRLRCGDFIGTAINGEPLSTKELKELGISP